MNQEKKTYLENMAKEIRRQTIKAIGEAGQGHIGGCLSIVELLTVLYFDEMKINPMNDKMDGRDRFVLSKGHAGPALYSALALAGFFDIECLASLNKPDTNLPSHCDMNKTKGIDMTAGSLGQGISCAVGIAIAAKIKGGEEYIYTIIGDGESQEGSVWEASMAASQFKLDNLIVFLDNNNLQIDGTIDEVMSLIDPCAKWGAFGFKTYIADGHDVLSISEAIAAAKKERDGKPSIIITRTIKGKGISFIEAEGAGNHSMALSAEQVAQALAELDGEVN
ncbi:MAG TPA: transketolase [Anaerovoracaceae bacterium]|nr:transketolase [Anaerovoracaceae bacterium]